MDKIRNEYIRGKAQVERLEDEVWERGKAEMRKEEDHREDSWVYQRKMKVGVSTCGAVRNVTPGGWWACMVADWRQLWWSRGKTAVMLMLMHSHTLYFEIRSYKHDIHGNLPGSNERKNVNLVNSVAIFSLCLYVSRYLCLFAFLRNVVWKAQWLSPPGDDTATDMGGMAWSMMSCIMVWSIWAFCVNISYTMSNSTKHIL